MTKSPTNNPILTIIVLNYNSQDFLKKCLLSIYHSDFPQDKIQILVPDNNSTDKSLETAQKIKQKNTTFIPLEHNLGFAKANNLAIKHISPASKYVLFLNPDTTVENNTLTSIITFLNKNPDVHAATCYVNLILTNSLQPECHRGFPTPWNALCHFFLPFLPKLFPRSKLFNGYFLGHLDYTKTQKIDACVGAFLVIRKEIGEKIGWWNEKYFFYGEDLDLCYKLKRHNFNLYFYPHCQIHHYQGFASGIVAKTAKKSAASRETRIRSALASTQAMRIFYQENLIRLYPHSLRWLVWTGIKLLETYRIFKAKFL